MKKTIKRGLCVGVDNSYPDSLCALLYYLPLLSDESGYTMCACPQTVYIPFEPFTHDMLLELVFSYIDITFDSSGEMLSIKSVSPPSCTSIVLE